MRTLRSAALPALACLVTYACQHIPPRPLAPATTAAAFERRTLADPGLAAFLEAAGGATLPEWPVRVWNLKTLTLAALYFQPSMDVARTHADAAGAAVETAAARPNPTLSIAPEYSTNPMGALSPWLMGVHLDWVVETAGKRRHRMERARADAEGARAAITAEAWRIRRQLATTLVAFAAARRTEAALADEVASEERLVALVESRVRSGAASMADVAPIRFALLQTTTDCAAAAASRADALARVAAALGVPTDALAGVTLPDGLDDGTAAQLAGIDARSARQHALLGRADVLQAVAAYASAEATLALELARQYPDLRVGPGYLYDQGENKWSVGLAVDLPILNRNEGPIREGAAARDEAAARLIATQAAVIADVEQAVARRAGELARTTTVHAALTDRDAQLARARSALAAGAADRSTVITTEVERGRAARAVIDADVALAQALIDLDAAIAGPLPPAALETPGATTIAVRASADGAP